MSDITAEIDFGLGEKYTLRISGSLTETRRPNSPTVFYQFPDGLPQYSANITTDKFAFRVVSKGAFE